MLCSREIWRTPRGGTVTTEKKNNNNSNSNNLELPIRGKLRGRCGAVYRTLHRHRWAAGPLAFIGPLDHFAVDCYLMGGAARKSDAADAAVPAGTQQEPSRICPVVGWIGWHGSCRLAPLVNWKIGTGSDSGDRERCT